MSLSLVDKIGRTTSCTMNLDSLNIVQLQYDRSALYWVLNCLLLSSLYCFYQSFPSVQDEATSVLQVRLNWQKFTSHFFIRLNELCLNNYKETLISSSVVLYVFNISSMSNGQTLIWTYTAGCRPNTSLNNIWKSLDMSPYTQSFSILIGLLPKWTMSSL